MERKILRIYANCVPVKGFNRSIIYDLTRRTFKIIPNFLYEILTQDEGKSKAEILLKYPDDTFVLNEYFELLEQEEFAFWIDDTLSPQFPNINFTWHHPSKVINATIEVRRSGQPTEWLDVFSNLETLGCSYIELRFACSVSNAEIYAVINSIKQTSFQSISLFLLDGINNCDIKCLEVLCEGLLQLKKLKIFNATTSFYKKLHPEIKSELILIPDTYRPRDDRKLFVVNMQSFSEAQQHNLYFNRKLIVSFEKETQEDWTPAHLCYTDMQSISDKISEQPYQELCTISKDKILICNVCEYRYMCLDKRLPQKIADNVWSYESECEYNPYLSKWNHEQGFLKLSECGIEIDRQNGIKIDEARLQQALENCWDTSN